MEPPSTSKFLGAKKPDTRKKLLLGKHVLRVIYVEGPKEIAVVTFYPGRRSRYEGSV
jgi:hypothetical protein